MPKVVIKFKKGDFILFGGMYITVGRPVIKALKIQKLIEFLEKKEFGKVYILTDNALKK